MAAREENCRTVLTYKRRLWQQSPFFGLVRVTEILVEVFDADGRKLVSETATLSPRHTVTLSGVRVLPEKEG